MLICELIIFEINKTFRILITLMIISFFYFIPQSFYSDIFQDTGKVMAITTGHNRYVACCAFSRDGNLLATGSNDKSVIVWDLKGNLGFDSELARRFTPALFLDNHEEVRYKYM